MSPTLERHHDLPADALVRATPEPHRLIVGLSPGRAATRGLHVEVECEHVRPVDLSTIARDAWLPPGHADRDEHLHHLAKISAAERALSELEGELQRLRRERVTSEIDGQKAAPMPDGDKLRAGREEALVTARAKLVRFADDVLGRIRAGSGEALAELEQTVHDRATKIEELRREMAALEAAQDADDSARRWLRSQCYIVRQGARVTDPGVGSWPPHLPGKGPSEVDLAVAARLKSIAGHAPSPAGI